MLSRSGAKQDLDRRTDATQTRSHGRSSKEGKVMLTKKILVIPAVVGLLALGGAGLAAATSTTGGAGTASAIYNCSATPYPEIDLAGCGLKNHNLAGAHLATADLANADLQGCPPTAGPPDWCQPDRR